jgi:hypothetical protein
MLRQVPALFFIVLVWQQAHRVLPSGGFYTQTENARLKAVLYALVTTKILTDWTTEIELGRMLRHPLQGRSARLIVLFNFVGANVGR